MEDDQLDELAVLYVISAYSAMSREVPSSIEAALGVCMHWQKASKIMGLQEWAEKMGIIENEEKPSDSGPLTFHIYRKDGTKQAI